MRRFATGSPRSIRFASATSSAAVSSLCRPTSARKSCSESAAPVERVGRPDLALGRLLLRRLLLRGGGLRRPDLEPDRLELARERLGLLVGQLVLERECLELGRLDVAALLGALDQRLDLLGLEQFDQLVLGQAGVSVPSTCGGGTNLFVLYGGSLAFQGLAAVVGVTSSNVASSRIFRGRGEAVHSARRDGARGTRRIVRRSAGRAKLAHAGSHRNR